MLVLSLSLFTLMSESAPSFIGKTVALADCSESLEYARDVDILEAMLAVDT